jgi:membrane-bound lytic murein transglycosylase D
MSFTMFRIILCILAFATPSFARSAELPSQGLEQRIDFWKKIFTQYGKDDVVIHDTFHVNLIYDVATDADVRTKTRAVQSALREIRANLTTPEKTSPLALQIRSNMAAQGIPVTASKLDELIKNVHTQRGIKERFRDGIVRSGRYVEEFRKIVQAEGVPVELALLPLVESSFQNVRSSAGAVGIWQFTRSTGRLYMKISGNVDQRLDPMIAARSAARLLRDNYKAIGVWPLAITAYNHGRAGMLRAQKAHGSDINNVINNYDGPLFGYASANFYAEFLAAVEVYESYPAYFGELVLDSPSAPPALQIASAATPGTSVGQTDQYRVRRGDTLSAIARRFGTSIRELMEMNNLKRSTIYVGELLLVK